MENKEMLRTPYEELNRSFVLRLLEDKLPDGRLKSLSDFLRYFAGIRASVTSAALIEIPIPWCLRVKIHCEPITVPDDNKEERIEQTDYVVDFLFHDAIHGILPTIQELVDYTGGIQNEKRALIHFGCSPESMSWNRIHNLPIQRTSPYEAFHSINAYEMSYFVGDGKRLFRETGERFAEIYAGIINSHAKALSLKNWQSSSRAFAYFCQNVLEGQLSEALGQKVYVQVKSMNSQDTEVLFTLPESEWYVFKDEESEEPIAFFQGLTLHLHYSSEEYWANAGLSFQGEPQWFTEEEAPFNKEKFEKYFLGKGRIKGFNWVKSIDDPFHDEFAFSKNPVWVRQYWGYGELDKNDYGKALVQNIVELLKPICD